MPRYPASKLKPLLAGLSSAEQQTIMSALGRADPFSSTAEMIGVVCASPHFAPCVMGTMYEDLEIDERFFACVLSHIDTQAHQVFQRLYKAEKDAALSASRKKDRLEHQFGQLDVPVKRTLAAALAQKYAESQTPGAFIDYANVIDEIQKMLQKALGDETESSVFFAGKAQSGKTLRWISEFDVADRGAASPWSVADREFQRWVDRLVGKRKRLQKPDLYNTMARKAQRTYHKNHRESRNAESRAYNPVYRQTQNFQDAIERRRTSIEARVNDFLKVVRQKGLVCTIVDTELRALFTAPCTYCGVDAPDSFHGIDRIEPDGNYESGNVTTACTACNMMRFRMTQDDFLRAARNVCLANTESGAEAPFPHDGPVFEFDGVETGQTSYSKIVAKDKIRYPSQESLSREVYDALSRAACTYCDRPAALSGMSIERLDSTLGHTAENCTAACSRCNYMSKKMSPDDYVSHCKRVALFYRVDEAHVDSAVVDKQPWAPSHLVGLLAPRMVGRCHSLAVKYYQPARSNQDIESDKTVYVSNFSASTMYHSIPTCGNLRPENVLSYQVRDLPSNKRRPCYMCRSNASEHEIARYCARPLSGETPEDIRKFWSAIRQKCGLSALE